MENKSRCTWWLCLIRNSISKTFKLVDAELPVPSTSSRYLTVTNWQLCVIGQAQNAEPLTCPSKFKRKDVGSGYSRLAENLVEFNELNNYHSS